MTDDNVDEYLLIETWEEEEEEEIWGLADMPKNPRERPITTREEYRRLGQTASDLADEFARQPLLGETPVTLEGQKEQLGELIGQRLKHLNSGNNSVFSNSGDDTVGQELADRLFADGRYMECSVPASEIALKAENLWIKKTLDKGTVKSSPNELFFIESSAQKVKKDVVWLGFDSLTDSGHSVQLGLVADGEGKSRRSESSAREAAAKGMSLIAVTRGAVAFTLVRFNRNTTDEYCTYLQFWGEDDMSELQSVNFFGWGKDDNGSRYDSVLEVGKLISGDTQDASALVRSLRLDSRLNAKLGETNIDTEQVLRKVFDIKQPEVELEHIYSNVKFKGYTSRLTVTGTLANVEGEKNRKKMTYKSFPSSQPEKNWPSQTAIFDRLRGITIIGQDDQARTPSEMELTVIKDLLVNNSLIAKPEQSEHKTFGKKLAAAYASFVLSAAGVANYATGTSLYLAPVEAAVGGGIGYGIYRADRGIKNLRRRQAEEIWQISDGEEHEDW